MNEDAIRQLTQALNANTEATTSRTSGSSQNQLNTRLGVGGTGLRAFFSLPADRVQLLIETAVRKGIVEGIKTTITGRGPTLKERIAARPKQVSERLDELLKDPEKNKQLIKQEFPKFDAQMYENLGQVTSDGAGKGKKKLAGLQAAAAERQKEYLKTQKDLEVSERDKIDKTKTFVKGLTGAVTAIAFVVGALIKFRDSLIQTSQQLGGVSLAKAFDQRVAAFFASLRTGFAISGRRILETQGELGQEFGQLATTGSATELTKVAQSYGLTAQQLAGLERTLQSNALSASEALDAFTQQGFLSGVAAEEMNKNMAAVARAGDKFNSFIVEGIKNAKRLGLEFGKIEQTLTGFATNFEGTIDQFAGLRAVIPGFETDFNQLFSTALYGSTNDFIEQIRTGLQGAGITSVEGMSRTALAQLEQSTGFTADQIDRILQNQDVNFDAQKDLDGNRNKLLKYILAGVGALIGAVAAGLAGVMIVTALSGFPTTQVASMPAALGFGIAGVATAAAFGASVGWATGKSMEGDDIVSNPGYGERTLVTPTGNIALNNQDQLIAGTNLYDKGELSGPSQSSVSMQGVEVKLDKLYAAIERQTQALQRGLRTEITGIDKGLTQLKDAEDRGLVYG